MARPLLIPNPENATINDLKQVSRVGSNETATRCTAIQMLLAGAERELVCSALLVTDRALRKWINAFNQSGVDGLIVKKRPGRMAIINGQQADVLAELIDQPQKADRTFWTAKARSISAIWDEVCSLAKIKGKSPHTARHAMGKHNIEKTGNVAAVQRQLGHKNAVYSMQYARISDKELEDVLEQR